jgi:hypothetical protein
MQLLSGHDTNALGAVHITDRIPESTGNVLSIFQCILSHILIFFKRNLWGAVATWAAFGLNVRPSAGAVLGALRLLSHSDR